MEVTVHTHYIERRAEGPSLRPWTRHRWFFTEFLTDQRELSSEVTVCNAHQRTILEYEIEVGMQDT